MKRMDFLCASPSSTAICTSQGTRPQNRANSKPYIPCTSLNQIPFNPKSLYEKTRKSSADTRDSSSSSTNRPDFRRRSSADASNVKNPYDSSRYLLRDTPYIDWVEPNDHRYATALVPVSQTPRPRRSKDMPKEGRSSSSSSEHYRLPSASGKSSYSSSSSSMMVREWVSESGNYVSSLVPTTQNSNTKRMNTNANGSPPLKSSSSARSRDQVVVLRVSIHCKGCEGKVRKHISKMEGVTSFKIDLAAKKVTVVGDVTPLGVLASISKVKNAQLWPTSTASSPLYDPSPRWST